jgi:hypothetical protein
MAMQSELRMGVLDIGEILGITFSFFDLSTRRNEKRKGEKRENWMHLAFRGITG